MIRYADLGEAALLAYMVDELAALSKDGAAMRFDVTPAALIELAGLVQLALRHPHVPAHLRRSAGACLDGIRAGFATSPAILEVLRRGDDPTRDAPIPARRPS